MKTLDELHLARMINGVAGDAEHEFDFFGFVQGCLHASRTDVRD
jgi:hypothetical protein